MRTCQPLPPLFQSSVQLPILPKLELSRSLERSRLPTSHCSSSQTRWFSTVSHLGPRCSSLHDQILHHNQTCVGTAIVFSRRSSMTIPKWFKYVTLRIPLCYVSFPYLNDLISQNHFSLHISMFLSLTHIVPHSLVPQNELVWSRWKAISECPLFVLGYAWFFSLPYSLSLSLRRVDLDQTEDYK